MVCVQSRKGAILRYWAGMLRHLKTSLRERFFPGGLTRQIVMVIGGGMLATLAILAVAGGMIWSNRHTQIDEWIDWTDDLSLIVAEQTRQSVKASDLVLRAITDRVEEQSIENEEQFAALMSTKEVHDMLRQRAAGVPQIDVATVIGLDGKVLNFTRWWPAADRAPPYAKIDLSDRDYFKAQFFDPKLDVYISAPVENRGTGSWVFYLSRKIRGKSGKILGVAITGLRVDFFVDFYHAITGDSSRSISLFRQDGILMARYPVQKEYLGKVFRGGAILQAGMDKIPESVAKLTYAPRITDPTDTSPRIVAPRQVPDYPLVVNPVISDDEFLANWRRNSENIIALAAALCLFNMGLTLALASMLSRQNATMRELVQSRSNAEVAAQAKSEFLAMMSHEIRTPINAVIGMSDALIEATLPERERVMARIVNDASNHLLSIVNTILDFSRLEAGQDKSASSPMELRRVVRTATDLAAGLPGAGRLQMISEVGRDVPACVLGDQGRVTQVLLNLLGNAVKFTERGGVELSVTCLSRNVEARNCVVRFAIMDTGSGIAKAVADRLFEPFERGEGWKSHKGSGTGLGLAISKRLVSLMGGRIGADGEPGVGSVFWFELPFTEVDQIEAAPIPLVIPQSRRAVDILVAEDSVTSQLVARHFLESMGHQVTMVENGALALAAVQQHNFDLVLMDGHMPEMDGLEATRKIRALGGAFVNLPIYGLSANVLNSDREQAAKAGMSGYLTKPVRKPDIAAVIAKLFPAEAV
jgi:signal transduction histidine kinase/ActR/RegA family two-component response regulator